MTTQLLGGTILLWVVRIVLLTCIALHITAAVQLTRMSRAARPHGYETKASIATTAEVVGT